MKYIKRLVFKRYIYDVGVDGGGAFKLLKYSSFVELPLVHTPDINWSKKPLLS